MSSLLTPTEFQLGPTGIQINIPSGFRLSVTSWENDADDYQTVVLSGLTEADVHFYLDLARAFRSTHGSGDGLGNETVAPLALVRLVDKALAAHPSVSLRERELWTRAMTLDCPDKKSAVDPEQTEEFLAGGAVYDLLCEKVLGTPVNYDYGFCRVFESFQVLQVEAPVVVDIAVDNVSEFFKEKSSVALPRRPGM